MVHVNIPPVKTGGFELWVKKRVEGSGINFGADHLSPWPPPPGRDGVKRRPDADRNPGELATPHPPDQTAGLQTTASAAPEWCPAYLLPADPPE